ncbi:MAG: hypothetical protein HYS14_03780, partial [Candidatus Rokubacteria bacterium]|nr:hypothetical protein [Candidatus Rokubacteria bacterium]
MLRRVSLIITFLLGICVAVPAGAQQPAKIPRIGFLCAMAGPSSHTEMFQQGLRELGYVEGKTIAVEY